MTEKYPLLVDRILPEHVGMEFNYGVGLKTNNWREIKFVGQWRFFGGTGDTESSWLRDGSWLVRTVEIPPLKCSCAKCGWETEHVCGVYPQPKKDEPKKKVLWAQALFLGDNNQMRISQNLYPSKDFAQSDWKYWKLIDWPVGVQIEREVEE